MHGRRVFDVQSVHCSGQVECHTRLQSTDFVFVPRSYKMLIYEDEHEDEDEKNQIRSHAYALRLFLFSAFRIPTSEFLV